MRDTRSTAQGITPNGLWLERVACYRDKIIKSDVFSVFVEINIGFYIVSTALFRIGAIRNNRIKKVMDCRKVLSTQQPTSETNSRTIDLSVAGILFDKTFQSRHSCAVLDGILANQ